MGRQGDGRDGGASRPDPIGLHVGQRIRRRRTAPGSSQDERATAPGLGYRQVRHCGRGLNRVGASRLHNITRTPDVSIGFF